MLHKTRNLVEDWREGDARKLATLEMEADVGWPGGGGWQTTAEEQERNIKESNLLGAIVTENEERIISLCTIRATPGQKAQAFIPHLNCHPDYHGKKHGKSALWGAMERAYEAGYQRVDLYTWPGNLQAVPLYKKMGFMWRPDSSVHMENFTPAARRHPLAAAFFARHDWYETHVRELKPEEDVMTRGRVKVYEYLWRAPDGDLLRLVFDRQSWGIIELENNELTVSCSLPDEKLVAGVPHAVRWRIVNKKPHPSHVFLAASGDPGVRVEKREAMDVADTAEIEETFVIDPNIEEKSREPKAAVLRTDLVIDGVGIELAAGIDVRQAVDVSVDAPCSILTPGKPQEATLTLRSNVEEACTVKLRVMPAGGVDVDARERLVSLDPKGGAELTAPLTAPRAGPVAIDAQATAVLDSKEVPVKTMRLDLLAVEPGGVSGGVGSKGALLCGGGLTVSADLRSGELYIYHSLRALRSRRLKLQTPRLGPPFAGGDLFQEKAEARIERDALGVVLRLRTPSVIRPGVWLDRRILVGQGPLVRVLDRVINGTSLPLDLSVSQDWWIQMGRTASLIVPGKHGVSRQAFGSGGRDLDDFRLPDEASAWPEGWFCVEKENGCTTGILWDRAERVSPGPWGSVRTRAVRVKPGASTSLDPVNAFVGDGNWETVRSWWRTLFGSVPEVETSEAPTRRPIECRIEPRPLVVTGDPVETTLRLDHVGRHKLDGELILEESAGLCPDVQAVKVTGLCQSGPVVRKVAFRPAAGVRPGAKEIRARFETEEAVYRFRQKALVLPAAAREVSVSRQKKGRVLAVDNGILSAKVAPAFMGTVISLTRDGREYLNCPYPNVEPRAWMNPWYGGLSPEYDRLEDTLYKERSGIG
ncbi:MAG: GNAT family N-acetyltransferase [Gemmatimonadota bacterium]|nr:GNAT family N-acetyltransferase [Gemmatimonadota bacterium]